MNRLTEKLDDRNLMTAHHKDGYYRPCNFHTSIQCYNKLGSIEDIEDKLGCPVDVLFKALRQGVYEIDNRGYIYHSDVSYIGSKYLVKVYYAWGDDEYAQFKYFKFEDYGKKMPGGWALTKEELQ